MLSTVAYSKTSVSSITSVMDEEYTAVLHRLHGMTSTACNDYLVRQVMAYIDRWPVDANPAAAPAPAAAPDAAAEVGGSSSEATDGDDFTDDWILLMDSDDEAEPGPSATQADGDGWTGA